MFNSNDKKAYISNEKHYAARHFKPGNISLLKKEMNKQLTALKRNRPVVIISSGETA